MALETFTDEEFDTGYTAEIHYDDSPESPREWSNVWECFTNQMDRQDIDNTLTPEQCVIECDNCDGTGEHTDPDNPEGPRVECDVCEGEGEKFDPALYLRKEHDAWLVANIFAYEHGLVQYRAGHSGNPFSCEWDSGMIGFAIITEKQLNDEFNGNEEMARKCLDSELEAYSDWANGHVYAYWIKDSDGEVIDSLHGMYGFDYTEKEAKDSLRVSSQNARESLDAKGPDKELKLELEEVSGAWCWTVSTKGKVLDAATRGNFEDAVEHGKNVYDEWKGN